MSLSFLFGAPALHVRAGGPLPGPVAPLAGGSLAVPHRGPPPSPSLHAVGARCWVWVPPLPSPPWRPLALSARGRLGGGPLCHRLVGCVPCCALAPWGVVPPFRPLCCSGQRRGGLALTRDPTSAVWAMAGECAGEYPASSFVSPPRLAWSPPTGPPAATAKAVSVGCVAGCPAPPAPVSVLAAASLLPIAAAPCGAAPSLTLVGCSWVGWVDFRLLPSARVRPPPTGIRMLWGLPGFCLPRAPRLLWGSSHPMTTQPPLGLFVELSHPVMTQLPPLPPIGG